jgi:hypothetical protein
MKVEYIVLILVGLFGFGALHYLSQDQTEESPGRAKYQRKLYCEKVSAICMEGDGKLHDFLYEGKKEEREAVQEQIKD